MTKPTIKNIKKILGLVFFLLIISTTASFAYFAIQISGSETTATIVAGSGRKRLSYVGGESISLSNLFPAAAAFATKSFTVTGNNRSPETIEYNIVLAIDENSLSYNAIKYTLSSTNINNNGTVATPITEKTGVGTGIANIIIGKGTFSHTAGTDKSHSYTIELYFPLTHLPQGIDLNKKFSAHIKIIEGNATPSILPELLGSNILAQYGGYTNITEAPASLFQNTSTESENVMYTAEDDYGTSYYYRGAKTHVNNNLIFAEHQWKIVRINGDGSIRIIYNGTCPNNSCTINTTGTSTQIGTTAFNSSNNDNKYVGYMFGGPMGSASTSRTQATTNETSSTIKTFLDSWYVSNILGTEYELYLSDTLFCNDRKLQSEAGGAATGTGFGSSETYYAANQRLQTTKNPNIKCGLKNDRFTVSDTIKGNGNLIYPVGLLSADEASLAGLKNGTSDTKNYLYTNQYWWLSSPYYFYSGNAYEFIVLSDGDLYSYGDVDLSAGGRPVLNLKSETTIQGTGTEISPYIVV